MNVIEKISTLCSEIENELSVYGDYVSDRLVQKTHELLTFVSTAPAEYKTAVEQQLLELVPKVHKYSKVWLYSAIIKLTYNPKVLEEFQKYIIAEQGFSANIKYFLYYQIRARVFVSSALDSSDIPHLQWKLLEQVIEMFKAKTADLLTPISEEQRDNGMVLVISDQILGERHAPTKVALDRCKILIEEMQRKVLLINTAESISSVGKIPYYEWGYANYLEECLTIEALGWKGTRIPFFQCENNMPNIEVLRMLLQMVRNMKPKLVISFGGSGILVNLVNTMIPVLNIGLSSDLEETTAACQTLGRSIKDSDRELLAKVGKDEGSVIQSTATFTPPLQKATVTRSALGLPEDKFILLIVGNRLDQEITEEFMEMLNQAADRDIVIALIGEFEPYEHYMAAIPKLRGKVYCLGRTDDLLAWMEVCDLYVNPHRKGGGTSALEALYKGLPVVTTAYGDVAANVGEDFWTESYETMPALIRRYRDDAVFYQEMSAKAKVKIAAALDEAGEFKRIIGEFERRIKTEGTTGETNDDTV